MRLLSRFVVLGVVLAVVGMIALQYERIIERNVALSRALGVTRADIAALKAKERKQKRVIERLSDPHGAIPEIHDRLHVVAPHEELIYLKAPPSPVPPKKDVEQP